MKDPSRLKVLIVILSQLKMGGSNVRNVKKSATILKMATMAMSALKILILKILILSHFKIGSSVQNVKKSSTVWSCLKTILSMVNV